jgi:deoxyribodipyrimidine photo-lyase
MSKQSLSIFWFRRDLRLDDNVGLYFALKEEERVLPVFIFDTTILDQLEDKKDRRVDFIHQCIIELQKQLIEIGSSMNIFHSEPLSAFKELSKIYSFKNVYANHDYEPYARERDEKIKLYLKELGCEFKTYKDQVIFEKEEVLKDDGKPYTIFTPYSRKWKSKLTEGSYKSHSTEKYFDNFFKTKASDIPSLKKIGFERTDIEFKKPSSINKNLLLKYKEQRDLPSVAGTSRMSMHLRFGTVSIRKLVRTSLNVSETWLNELIWREFYMMILWHFPHVVNGAFKKDYDYIKWDNNEKLFELWCQGKTGFPIVDAGMRELNSTGFMHNRVRMITSSFLIKDLLIDWKWGEAYFAQKLNDFDLSANNGGWQWAASSGCDAAPYFRIFNPTSQQERFDPAFEYIKKWVPEFGTDKYPEPIVDHKAARERTLAVYKKALNERKN